MFRNDRSYDFGLRGAPSRPPRRYDSRPATRYDAGFERRGAPEERRASRVTAPYTYDYVYGNRGERYPRNLNRFTGDRPGRVRDADAYAPPYMTEGGTRTWRGSPPPPPYDAPFRGPDYGGRYPDEL